MANVWETSLFDDDSTPKVDPRDALYEERPWDPYDLRLNGDIWETCNLFASFEGEDSVASLTETDPRVTEL